MYIFWFSFFLCIFNTHFYLGIGYKTAKRLETLGVRSVCDLQAFPSPVLEKELGASVAQRIQKLGYGEDDSPVTPSGRPQVQELFWDT